MNSMYVHQQKQLVWHAIGVAVLLVMMWVPTRSYALEDSKPYWAVMADIDGAVEQGDGLLSWRGTAWYGGDFNRLWVKSEGERVGSKIDDGELQVAYGHLIGRFWDGLVGVRKDVAGGPTFAVIGIQGLAPYRFDAEAFAFFSDEGDVSVRTELSYDVRFTQRLTTAPYAELDWYLTEDAKRGIGGGLGKMDAGIQLRYELLREVAPYIDLNWINQFGGSRKLAQATGSTVAETVLRFGVRFRF